MRELVLMLEARRREEWDHTSTVLAMLANVNRDPKRRPTAFTPAEFHPMSVKPTHADLPKIGVRELKQVLSAKGPQDRKGS